MQQASVWIGFDSREPLAYEVAAASFRREDRLNQMVTLQPIVLKTMQDAGFYWRPMEERPAVVDGGRAILWDVISEAPMATEFSITRFLAPILAPEMDVQTGGWVIFTDCDVLVRKPLRALLQLLDPRYAVMCVKHAHVPTAAVKMRGDIQLSEFDRRAAGRYTRKNWSSVCAYNLDHPSNQALTVDLVNQLPGRDLHRFCWLADDEIGALPAAWNYLVGITQLEDPAANAGLVHFTDGLPNMVGYERTGHPLPFVREWWDLAYNLGAYREGYAHQHTGTADHAGNGETAPSR